MIAFTGSAITVIEDPEIEQLTAAIDAIGYEDKRRLEHAPMIMGGRPDCGGKHCKWTGPGTIKHCYCDECHPKKR